MRLMLFGGVLLVAVGAALSGCYKTTPLTAPPPAGERMSILAKTPEGCTVYELQAQYFLAICPAGHNVAISR